MAKLIYINKVQIKFDTDLLETILDLAILPSGKILLVLNNGPLTFNNLGVCIPKSLLKYSRGERVFNPYEDDHWDCGIAISKKACFLKQHFPAYFVYLLGHELGHAYICLSNITIHIYSCLIQNFIVNASNNVISQWHELPHEIRFDQFGIYIAEKIFSREILNKEIFKLLSMQDCKDKPRLKKMLQLSASLNLKGLKNELIKFSIPYKNELINLWKIDKLKNKNLSLVNLIKDYEELFHLT